MTDRHGDLSDAWGDLDAYHEVDLHEPCATCGAPQFEHDPNTEACPGLLGWLGLRTFEYQPEAEDSDDEYA